MRPILNKNSGTRRLLRGATASSSRASLSFACNTAIKWSNNSSLPPLRGSCKVHPAIRSFKDQNHNKCLEIFHFCFPLLRDFSKWWILQLLWKYYTRHSTLEAYSKHVIYVRESILDEASFFLMIKITSLRQKRGKRLIPSAAIQIINVIQSININCLRKD